VEEYLCSMNRASNVLLLLYLLLGYVIAQFLWWAYSIYDLNVALATLEVELLTERGEHAANLVDELSRKRWMIIGEGSVFAGLLMIGAYYIRKFLLREQRLARQERNFLLATTHEFNSPIAGIKLNLQTLERRKVNEQQQKTLVAGALSSTQRLELLVSNILMASRLDAGKMELHRETIDVREVLIGIEQRYRDLAVSDGCMIAVFAGSGVELSIDRNAVEIILGNLVENAIKYAPNATITLKCEARADEVLISVIDQGRGIPKEERGAIFQKFYRAENEETRSQKGSGLGLYLVKELVEMHGGKVYVHPNQPSGSIFTITFLL
jgi:two-component system sensor histidine kinase CiaH